MKVVSALLYNKGRSLGIPGLSSRCIAYVVLLSWAEKPGPESGALEKC